MGMRCSRAIRRPALHAGRRGMLRRPVDVAVDFHRMEGCGKIKNMPVMIKSKYERSTCAFNSPATARRTVAGSRPCLAAILATRRNRKAAVTAILQCQTGNRPKGYPAAWSGPPGKAARAHAKKKTRDDSRFPVRPEKISGRWDHAASLQVSGDVLCQGGRIIVAGTAGHLLESKYDSGHRQGPAGGLPATLLADFSGHPAGMGRPPDYGGGSAGPLEARPQAALRMRVMPESDSGPA